MERLWAPWRMEYIRRDQGEGCVFCAQPAANADEERFLLHRDAHCYLILNAYPYVNGHLLVVPYRHVADFLELTPAEAAGMLEETRRAVAAMARAFRPDGYNIGMNVGRAAGAGVADHLHLHVLPRWVGDTNFATTVANMRVVPEAPAETYRRLREALAAETS